MTVISLTVTSAAPALASERDQQIFTVEAATEDPSDEDADELFDGYIRRQLGLEIDEEDEGLVANDYDNVPMANEFYHALKAKITALAANGGEAKLVLDKAFFNESMNLDTHALEIGLSHAVNRLLADCPYELYWFDKTEGYTVQFEGVYIDEAKQKIRITGATIKMHVALSYRAGADFVVTDQVSKVGAAVEEASRVVNVNRNLSDKDKLIAYKNYICDAVSYNYEAFQSGSFTKNVDAWQLISVFDKDPNTNVVCEGYSKAFQYLYNRSEFSGEAQSCMLVSGHIVGKNANENHMWNIVRLNGVNLIADLTNSDKGMAGEYGGLFLSNVVTKDSTVDKYTMDLSLYQQPSATYEYDETTKEMFDVSERSILPNGASSQLKGLQVINGRTYFIKDDGSTAKGWMMIDGRWYFFNDDGARVIKTKQQEINGSKYYLNENGVIQTGWFNEQGKWHFYGADGVESKKTGLQIINKKRYYLKDDGSVTVGWKKVGKEWHLFDQNGQEIYAGTFNKSQIVQVGDTYYSVSDAKVTEADGLYSLKNVTTYIHKGKLDKNYTGLVKHTDKKWYYVQKGVVSKKYNGLVRHTDKKWYRVENSVINFNRTALIKHTDKKWYYVQKGVINFNYTGLVKHTDKKWYYVQKGVINFNYTGLVKHTDKKWYYVQKGVINFNHTGLVKHTDKKWYYVQKGVINFKYTGLVKHTDKKWYYVQKGVINFKYTGLVKHTDKKWYYVQKGVINFNYTGLVKHTDKKLYYVQKGVINFKYNGSAKYNNKKYKIVKGVAK